MQAFPQKNLIDCDTFPSSDWKNDTLGIKGYRLIILEECLEWERESLNYLPANLIGLDTTRISLLFGNPDLRFENELKNQEFIYFLDFHKIDNSQIIYDKDINLTEWNKTFTGSYIVFQFNTNFVVEKSYLVWLD